MPSLEAYLTIAFGVFTLISSPQQALFYQGSIYYPVELIQTPKTVEVLGSFIKNGINHYVICCRYLHMKM